jgi:multiple antibiotic resistance protein
LIEDFKSSTQDPIPVLITLYPSLYVFRLRIHFCRPGPGLLHRRPPGKHPFFLAITEGADTENRRKIAFRASLVSLFILLLFAFVGEWILRLFRVSISSFQIAGGILIFIIALSMLQARRSRAKSTPREEQEGVGADDVAVFPLAIPMLAGPAAITTVMVLINLSASPVQKGLVALAIVLTCFFSYWFFRESSRLLGLLGQTGINVLTRLMGFLLAVISVQFVIDGVKAVISQIMTK